MGKICENGRSQSSSPSCDFDFEKKNTGKRKRSQILTGCVFPDFFFSKSKLHSTYYSRFLYNFGLKSETEVVTATSVLIEPQLLEVKKPFVT